jgi:Ca2+-binding RTX toxin-like protein
MHARLAPLLATAALLAAAPAARADTITIQGSTIVYTGAPGEANQVDASRSTDCGALSSPCVRINASVNLAPSSATPPAQCHTDGFDWVCPLPTSITYNLGDQDDQARDWDGASTIDGGPGPDALFGRGGNDVIDGGPDLDFVIGGPDNDQLQGGLGDDVLESMANTFDAGDPADSSGTDTVAGGPGQDTMSYKGRTEPLSITINNVADDGAAGEGDLIQPDVESVMGGNGNDTITGDAGPNLLYGLQGDDVIHGGPGDDTVDGGPGHDTVSGDDGVDRVFGGDDADVVDGGPGPDTISGDNETPCLVGPCFEGADDIRARDGATDTINCYGGTDTVVADAVDRFPGLYGAADCESIDAPAAPTTGSGGGSTPTGTPPGSGPASTTGASSTLLVTVPKSITRRALLRKGLAVKVKCTAACRLTARLLAGRKVVGRASGRRTSAGALTLRIKLTRAGRRTVRHRHSLVLSVADATSKASARSSVRIRG